MSGFQMSSNKGMERPEYGTQNNRTMKKGTVKPPASTEARKYSDEQCSPDVGCSFSGYSRFGV